VNRGRHRRDRRHLRRRALTSTDNRREIAGKAAIREWVAHELVGDEVRMDVREVTGHHGDTIVRAALHPARFDRTNLPDDLVLTSYFSVRDGAIVSLAVILQPAVALLSGPPRLRQ